MLAPSAITKRLRRPGIRKVTAVERLPRLREEGVEGAQSAESPRARGQSSGAKSRIISETIEKTRLASPQRRIAARAVRR